MSVLKKYFQEEFQWPMLLLDHAKPSDFYLSRWQSTRSSVPLLMCRAGLFISSVSIVIASVVYYIQSGFFGYWFIYLTHWGLLSIVFATGAATAVSARCFLYGPITTGAESSLPWYVKVYWVFYNITVPLAFLITVFYWTLLYNTEFEEEMNHSLDVAIHGLNSIIVFLLVISTSHPTRLLHFVYPLDFAVVYVFFGIIYYIAGGVDTHGNRYIYPVIDWSSPGPTLGLAALTGLLLVMLHLLTTGLAVGRDALALRCCAPAAARRDEAMPLRAPAQTVLVAA